MATSFVSEPIVPVEASFDTAEWPAANRASAKIPLARKGIRGGGSAGAREGSWRLPQRQRRTLREKHDYRVRTTDGTIMNLYFQRSMGAESCPPSPLVDSKLGGDQGQDRSLTLNGSPRTPGAGRVDMRFSGSGAKIHRARRPACGGYLPRRHRMQHWVTPNRPAPPETAGHSARRAGLFHLYEWQDENLSFAGSRSSNAHGDLGRRQKLFCPDRRYFLPRIQDHQRADRGAVVARADRAENDLLHRPELPEARRGDRRENSRSTRSFSSRAPPLCRIPKGRLSCRATCAATRSISRPNWPSSSAMNAKMSPLPRP